MAFARIAAVVLLVIMGVGARFGVVAYHRNQAEAARRRAVSAQAIRDMKAALDRNCREQPPERQAFCDLDTEARVAQLRVFAADFDR